MRNGVPPGWTSSRLSELVVAKKGKKPAVLRKNPAVGFVPYLDIKAIEKKEIRQFAEVKSSRLASEKDLFVVWDGARSGWIGAGVAGAIGSTIMALTPRQGNPEYLRYFVTSHFRTINTRTRGTGIPHVDPEVFWNLEVPLPPLSEQLRIVTKLEELLAKVADTQDRLTRIPILLKRFRQSVLAAACSGRLTADWRQEHSGTEPVQRLGKGNPPDGFYLPPSWNWWLSEHVFDFVTSGSRGWAKYYSKAGALFIRVGNLDHDSVRLDLQSVQHVRPPQNAEGRRTRVQRGDILISITADVGMIALVDQDIGEAYINQHVALARPTGSMDNRYLAFFFTAENGGREQFLSLQRGATKIGLGLDDIRNIWIACPPLAEQQEIVRRVEALFALADQIEARFARAKAHTDNLTESILSKAFRGELIPTEREKLEPSPIG